MQKNLNLALTGGHAATTAISVIKEIKKTHKDWNLYWIGPKSAVEGKYIPTLASTVMPSLNVKFIPILTGRLQRKFTPWTIPSLLKIPYGFIQSFMILSRVRPKAVVSFGGYASVPVCLVAKIFGIPVVVHEQTSGAGLANKIVGGFANRILIARKESAKFFDPAKTTLIGNPVRQEFLNISPKRKLPKTPTVYITGGSSGSVPMNKVINKALPEIIKKYKIIHQTGKIDFNHFKKLENKNYKVYESINADEIPRIFEKTDLLISRAGANTISEIIITKRPAILIPIPWVQNDEQTKNAQMAENLGLAIIIKQDEFNPETLIHGLEYLTKNFERMVSSKGSEFVELDKSAATRFVEILETFLQ